MGHQKAGINIHLVSQYAFSHLHTAKIDKFSFNVKKKKGSIKGDSRLSLLIRL